MPDYGKPTKVNVVLPSMQSRSHSIASICGTTEISYESSFGCDNKVKFVSVPNLAKKKKNQKYSPWVIGVILGIFAT